MPAWQSLSASDPFATSSYALVPARFNGAGLVPAYQVQTSYQYSAPATFGLALGREVEAFVPAFDPAASGPGQMTFTAQHWPTPSWALSYDVLSQDAVQSLRSLGLRLGVRYSYTGSTKLSKDSLAYNCFFDAKPKDKAIVWNDSGSRVQIVGMAEKSMPDKLSLEYSTNRFTLNFEEFNHRYHCGQAAEPPKSITLIRGQETCEVVE